MTNVYRREQGAWLYLVFAVLALALSACAAQPAASAGSTGYTGTALNSLAEDFRLRDQTGAAISLADYKGKVVVLTFLDDQCQDICPLTAAQLRSAYQSLGSDAASVGFIGINVNEKANQAADVMAATKEWRLDDIPSWHFLTGQAGELEPIWQAYGIEVQPQDQGELLHTMGIYLIDQAGRKRRYISNPDEGTATPQWTVPVSELVAQHVRELLSER
jgi:protein SCO1/2